MFNEPNKQSVNSYVPMDERVVSSKTLVDETEQPDIEPYERTQNRQYLRDIILGVNDGLVSMFLLVFGMAGGNSKPRAILLAGITGAIAGAISMGLGEFIATKSQAEIFVSDEARERQNLIYHRPSVIEQVREKAMDMGFRGDLLERNVAEIASDDDRIIKFLYSGEEDDEDSRNPLIAMAVSGCLFLGGSIPSVVPFCFLDNDDWGKPEVTWATVAAGCGCLFFLFMVGFIKCLVTKANPVWGGLENAIFGAIGAAASFGVGQLFDVISPQLGLGN